MLDFCVLLAMEASISRCKKQMFEAIIRHLGQHRAWGGTPKINA